MMMVLTMLDFGLNWMFCPMMMLLVTRTSEPSVATTNWFPMTVVKFASTFVHVLLPKMVL